jgi:hypothetical protein
MLVQSFKKVDKNIWCFFQNLSNASWNGDGDIHKWIQLQQYPHGHNEIVYLACLTY